jgi:hypothetical protein
VLEDHLFQYLESEVNRAIANETTSEMVTSTSVLEVTSGGSDVCTFEIEAIIPIFAQTF